MKTELEKRQERKAFYEGLGYMVVLSAGLVLMKALGLLLACYTIAAY